MFGFGKRRGGLLSGLFGGNRQPAYTQQRRGLLNNPLARAALIAGAGYLGSQWLRRRQGQGGLFSGSNNTNTASGGSDWGTPSNPSGNQTDSW